MLLSVISIDRGIGEGPLLFRKDMTVVLAKGRTQHKAVPRASGLFNPPEFTVKCRFPAPPAPRHGPALRQGDG